MYMYITQVSLDVEHGIETYILYLVKLSRQYDILINCQCVK